MRYKFSITATNGPVIETGSNLFTVTSTLHGTTKPIFQLPTRFSDNSSNGEIGDYPISMILYKRDQQNSTSFITVRKWSCGKVMFSQAYVKNSVPGGRCTPPWADPPGTHPPWANTPPGRQSPWAESPHHQTPTAADGTHSTGMHSCFDLII